jgi:hypothetical protein
MYIAIDTQEFQVGCGQIALLEVDGKDTAAVPNFLA